MAAAEGHLSIVKYFVGVKQVDIGSQDNINVREMCDQTTNDKFWDRSCSVILKVIQFGQHSKSSLQFNCWGPHRQWSPVATPSLLLWLLWCQQLSISLLGKTWNLMAVFYFQLYCSLDNVTSQYQKNDCGNEVIGFMHGDITLFRRV